MITENLSTLKIHKLTQEQYDRELAAGNIDENAIYLTPDKDVSLDGYATEEYVNEQISSNIAELATKTYVDGKMDTAIELPIVTTANNGAVLGVVDGKWAITTILNAEEVEF